MKKNLLDGLIDPKKLTLLALFSRFPERIFNLTELAKVSKIPIATTQRMLPVFVENQILEQIDVAKSRLYRLAKNEKTSKLKGLLKND